MLQFFRIQKFFPELSRNSAFFGGSFTLFILLLASNSPAADWQKAEGYRSREINLPANGRTFLQRLAPAETGITFTNFLSEEKGQENSLLTLGAGVAAGDIDGDGLCDLYFIGTQKPNAL